jgi:hypothetical protein
VVDDFGFLENFDGDFLTGGHVDAWFDFAEGSLTEGFSKEEIGYFGGWFGGVHDLVNFCMKKRISLIFLYYFLFIYYYYYMEFYGWVVDFEKLLIDLIDNYI